MEHDDPRHGTDNAYRNLACRCSRCRRAHTTQRRLERLGPEEDLMATCADCGQEFSGTPWRYNPGGQRVHVDCSTRPPAAMVAGGGNDGNGNATTWDLYPVPVGTTRADQGRWRHEIARLASTEPEGWWTPKARSLRQRRRGFTARQGGMIEAMVYAHRSALNRPSVQH